MQVPENIEDWREAGRIAARALNYGKGLIKPGARMEDVADDIERFIEGEGAGMAFPVQMSCNHIAAHYCPEKDDEIMFENQLVCLDVGVHVNGAIGDNARTVDLSGRYSELVRASEEALDNAISIIKDGITLGEIGRAIQEAIEKRGFTPITNLGGHGLGLFNIHTSPTIPNYDTGDRTMLTAGQIIAIEPFATDGAGKIYESDRANIFAAAGRRPVRNAITRNILSEIQKFRGLPFTTRWLLRKFPAIKVNFALKELLNLGVIRDYPPLPEQKKGMVSQAEHSIMVTEDGCEILTKG